MDLNPDYLAFAFLILCVASTFASHMIAERLKTKDVPKPKKDENGKYVHLFAHEARLKEVETFHTSKSLRKAYRKNWAERILAAKAYPEIREIIRNLIMTNVAFLSAVLISFGLLVSGFTVLTQVGGEAAALKMVAMSTLLLYSLFMLISESRILNYVPILIWVDAEIIASMQNEEKVDYIAQLMDDAFDCFSNSLRALFYAVICVFWFFDLTAFIIATALLTVIIVSSDFDRKIKISIF